MALLRLHCPECCHATALHCDVTGQGRDLSVTLVTQTCLCDPFGAWEDVWEEARERIFEDRAWEEEHDPMQGHQ